MLDQSFSYDTFKEIFDKANRKGINVEKLFRTNFTDSLTQLQLIQNKSVEIRNESDIEKRKNLIEEKKDLKREREKLLEGIISQSAEEVHNDIKNLTLGFGPKIGKQTYTLEHTLSNFFMSKKVQSNIARTYKVKQGNRYAILSRLVNLLEDDVPKYILRLDITKFYESIPQNDLLQKINDDYLLSALSKKFINQVFAEYNRMTNQLDSDSPIGIPRGIGISPYLSELFMRSIDKEISKLKDIVYYERYVDDIIAIFTPERRDMSSLELKEYKTILTRIISSNGLSVNESKTKAIDLIHDLSKIHYRTDRYENGLLVSSEKSTKDNTFHFLGYNFGSLETIELDTSTNKSATKRSILIRLSDKKMKSYKRRIKLAFEHHKQKSGKNEKKTFTLLKSRVEFLTSNTKLRNNKSQVLIGVFYSNPFVNDMSCFEELDRSLAHYISRSGLQTSKKLCLKEFRFIDGFVSRRFLLYPIKKKKYKNHNAKKNDHLNNNNSGIVQFGLKEINSIWRN